jgi:hypothetical protein
MKKILGIFRGFPGLGRIVAGVAVLEMLHDKYNYETKAISYLQGAEYLELHNYIETLTPSALDYCAIGILPTSKFGASIHCIIKEFLPDVILIDGEPLMLQSCKISYPNTKIVALLNPADVDNPKNDKEAMDFFNSLYTQCDLAIVHGTRSVKTTYAYRKLFSLPTILRKEILDIRNCPSQQRIYCLLGGGSVNVDEAFSNSTLRMAYKCIALALNIPNCTIDILCSSNNIFESVKNIGIPKNVILHKNIICPQAYYSKASLVITRSGRNTLSELAYLGIPTVAFVTEDSFRNTEQMQNILSIRAANIHYSTYNSEIEDFTKLCTIAMNDGTKKNEFDTSGLYIATKLISEL